MKTAYCSLAALTGGVILLSAIAAPAQDWPQWRGPDGAARVSGFAAPKTWPKTLTQKWQVPVGDGVATPSLVGEKLYVFSRQGGAEILRCLDAATGKELWQDKYEALGSDDPGGYVGPRSSPAVADGKVVTLGVRGMLSCLDATTGAKLWRKNDFPGAAQDVVPRFFVASSPIIVNGLVIAQLGGRINGALVAYDLTSGEQKWKWTGDAPGYASPVVMTIGNTKLIVAETDRRVVAVNAADGKLVWEMPYAVQGRGYNASTPVVDGQTVIISGSSRGTKAVKIEASGDGFVGKELWSNPDKSVQFNTPVLKDGFVYGLTGGNEFFCLNAKDGQTAWGAPIAKAGDAPPSAGPGGGGTGGPQGRGPGGGGPPGGGRGGRGGGMGGGGGYGSIVDAGSVLVALTPASQLVVFQPGDKAYTEVARIKAADSKTYAYPVLAGNRIFIKDKDAVTLWTIE